MDRKNKEAPQTYASGTSGEKDGKLGSSATRREATFRALVSVKLPPHSWDRMTVDSGDGWGELAERKENFHSVPGRREATLDVEPERPPYAYLPASSRDHPDLMQSKNLNISASCILLSNMGIFNDPTISLVNADTLHTDSDSELHASDEPPLHTSRFGIPIPPRKIRFRGDQDDAQRLLKYVIYEDLRSRRHIINSASTAGSPPKSDDLGCFKSHQPLSYAHICGPALDHCSRIRFVV